MALFFFQSIMSIGGNSLGSSGQVHKIFLPLGACYISQTHLCELSFLLQSTHFQPFRPNNVTERGENTGGFVSIYFFYPQSAAFILTVNLSGSRCPVALS